MATKAEDLQLGTYKYGWHDDVKPVRSLPKGLSAEVVEEISAMKGEPRWMRDFRLKAYRHFERRPMPNWGADLSGIDFDDIHYFVQSTEQQANSWDELPPEIKETYDKLGIPEAEKQRLIAGVAAQYESTVLYHKIREDLEAQGVVFLDTDTALKEHEDLFREHFGKVIPPNDNKLAALNSAVWSGGSFIWVPEGVKVDIPLQAYFRINQQNMGQFERTLIIAEPGSYVHYVEGCTAPIYSSDSLHSAVVEIIVKEGARVRYTTIQNWSHNVYNLVTKRAVAHEDAVMEWVDGNLGSKVTMKYPSIYLLGERAHGEVLSIAFAGEGQHQDAGGKVKEARFAIVGMGKMGGFELNYHSDLDIIYIYDYQGFTSGERSITNHEYFAKLGQKIISILTTQTREGYVYKIDTRLRPSGNAGPLVTSLDSHKATERERILAALGASNWNRVKAAKLVYRGRVEPVSLGNAMRSTLEANGWRHISTATVGEKGTTQVYDKSGHALQVRVWEGWYYTYVELTTSRALLPPTSTS